MNAKICLVMVVVVLAKMITLDAAEEDKAKAATPDKPESKLETKEADSIFKNEKDEISYIIGTQMGRSLLDLKKKDFVVNMDMLFQGLKDTFDQREPVLAEEQARQTYQAFLTRIRTQQAEKQKKQAAENLAAGTKFMEENKNKPGVKTLPSGLQYKIITEGTGPKPNLLDKVKIHYRGTLLNGQEFDNSYKQNEPVTAPVSAVIDGWTEAIQLMKTGAKWQLFIPPKLAYRESERPGVPPNSTLIFEIELLEIVKNRPKKVDNQK
jgi:FKBP-type peptidyl-prolyl cis-trans isomerase FklB